MTAHPATAWTSLLFLLALSSCKPQYEYEVALKNATSQPLPSVRVRFVDSEWDETYKPIAPGKASTYMSNSPPPKKMRVSWRDGSNEVEMVIAIDADPTPRGGVITVTIDDGRVVTATAR